MCNLVQEFQQFRSFTVWTFCTLGLLPLGLFLIQDFYQQDFCIRNFFVRAITSEITMLAIVLDKREEFIHRLKVVLWLHAVRKQSGEGIHTQQALQVSTFCGNQPKVNVQNLTAKQFYYVSVYFAKPSIIKHKYTGGQSVDSALPC